MFLNRVVTVVLSFSSLLSVAQNWPINQTDDATSWNRISATFGEIHPTDGDHFHGAIDIDVTTLNCPVRTIDNGRVRAVGSISIEVEHVYPTGGTSYYRRSRYLHVNQGSSLPVTTVVTQGNQITTVQASSGNPGTADHLHLEMWEFQNGNWYRLNPFENETDWELNSPTDNSDPEINDVFLQSVTQPNNVGSGFSLYKNLGGLTNQTTNVKIHFSNRPGSTGQVFDSEDDKLVVFGNIIPIVGVRDVSINNTGSSGNGLTIHRLNYRINNILKYQIYFDKINSDTELYSVDDIFHTEFNNGGDHQFGNNDFIELYTTDGTYLSPDKRVNNIQSNGVWFTKAPVSTQHVFSQTPTTIATHNDNALYSDGLHTLRFETGDASGRTDAVDLELIVDNFRPYIKEVLIKKFGPYGDLIYHGKWEWSGSALQDDFLKKNDAGPQDHIWVKITTSEPVESLNVNLEAKDGSSYFEIPAVNSINTEFVTTYTPIATPGGRTLRIQANDLAGNPLQSNPAQIPIRQTNGTWSAVTTTGIDANHQFNSGTFVCSDGSSGGRKGSGSRTSSSGCLYVDFSTDKTNVQTSEVVTYTPVVSGSGAITYNWNFGSGAMPATSTGSGPQPVIYTTGGAKSVTLQICDNTTNCITEEKVGVVTVNAQPGSSTLTVDFSVDRYGANVGEPFQFTSTVTGASGAVTYNWDFGEGLATGILTSANPTVTYATPGNKTISLTVTDANGSVSKVRTSWLYVNSPTFNISTSITGCGNASSTGVINLAPFGTTGGNGPPYNSYLWDFGDGTIQEKTSSESVNHQYKKKGKYTVRLTVCDETGCGTAEQVDCVNAVTVVGSGEIGADFLIDDRGLLSPPYVVGLNTPVIYTPFTSGGSGDPKFFDYNWVFESHYYGGSGNSAIPQSSQTIGPKAQEVYYTTTGLKEVSLTVVDAINSDRETKPSAINVVAGLGSGRCFATLGTSTVSSTCWSSTNPPVFTTPILSKNCPVAKIEVFHYVNESNGYVLNNGVLDFSNYDPEDIPTFPFTSTFVFHAYQYDGMYYNSIGYKVQSFTFYGPAPAIAGPDQQICLGSTAILGGTITDGVGYTWSTTNSSPLAYLSSTSSASPTFNAVQKGTFKYRVTATNLLTGCTTTDDVTIVVDKPEVATSTFWAKLATPLPLSVSSTGGFGNNTYNWSPANYLSSSSTSNPSFTTSVEGDYNYMVTATDQRGCQGSGQIFVNASSAPGNLVAKAEAYSRISLTWVDRSDNETGFVIQRSVGSTSGFVDYGTTGFNINYFDDLNIESGVTYYYKVLARISSTILTNFSNIASINTENMDPFTKIVIPGGSFINSSVSNVFGDFNNDGIMELVVIKSSVTEIYSYGSNGFVLVQSIPKTTLYGARILDYDNDNDLDILLIQSVILINTNGIFSVGPSTLTFGGEIELCDSDKNNFVDLLSNYYGVPNYQNEPLRIHLNNGFGSFNETITSVPAYHLQGSPGNMAKMNDMDNDGDQDIVLANNLESPPTRLSLYLNSNQNFSNTLEILNDLQFIEGDIDIGDFDKSGVNDVLITGGCCLTKKSRLFKSNQNSTFSEIFYANIYGRIARFGDYNMDGNLDFFYSSNTLSSIYTNENLQFPLKFQSNLNLGFSDWVDFDGDGDLDIIGLWGSHAFINNYGINKFKVNTKPSPPSNLCIYFNGNRATFSWDPATDIETPSPGLTYNLYVKQNGQFIMAPMANIDNGFRKVVGRGNVSQNTSWTIALLGTGNIEWGVQTIDNQYVGSVFAKNLLSPVQTACGNITTSITVGGRDILAPNVCSPNETIVSNGATLTLEAGNLIRLLPGFKVLPGSFLHGRLTNYTSTDNPCIFESPEGKISEEGSVEETGGTDDQISVYPNPNKGNFTIEASFEQEANTVEVSVISLSGNTIFSRRYNSVEYLMQEIDIVQFPQGVYLIRVIKDNITIYRKVVKI